MPQAPQNYIPQLAPASAVRRRQAVMVWGLTSTAVSAVVALIIIAPLALAWGHNNLGAALYRGFSLVCHQIPGRSFHLHDHPLAVCARCSGLYFGLAAGLLTYPLWRSLSRVDTPARGWLILALVPVGVDFWLGFSGMWENTPGSRALTGAILGVAIAFYLVPGLVDLRFHWRTYFNGPPATLRPLTTIENKTLAASVPSDYSAPARRLKL